MFFLQELSKLNNSNSALTLEYFFVLFVLSSAARYFRLNSQVTQMFPKEWEELHIWQKIDSTFTKVYNKVKKVSWYEWGYKSNHYLLLHNENSELSIQYSFKYWLSCARSWRAVIKNKNNIYLCVPNIYLTTLRIE